MLWTRPLMCCSKLLGRALDVPSDYFSKMIDTGNSVLRAIHYPPVGDAPPAGSIRAAAHGDINLITILMGATASGLQLLDRDGQWLDVETERRATRCRLW